MWCAVAGGKEWLVEVMEGVVLPVVCGWDSLMTMTQIWEPDPRPARLSAPQHPCPSRLGTVHRTLCLGHFLDAASQVPDRLPAIVDFNPLQELEPDLPSPLR